MAITVRKEATLKEIEKLEKELNIKTKTGVLDHVVKNYMYHVTSLKEAEDKNRRLENELYEIKKIIRQNTQAVRSFSQMCDKIASENY